MPLPFFGLRINPLFLISTIIILLLFGMNGSISARYSGDSVELCSFGTSCDKSGSGGELTKEQVAALIEAIADKNFIGNPDFINALVAYMADPRAGIAAKSNDPSAVSLSQLAIFLDTYYAADVSAAGASDAIAKLEWGAPTDTTATAEYNKAVTAAQQQAKGSNSATGTNSSAADKYQAAIALMKSNPSAASLKNLENAASAAGMTVEMPQGGVGAPIITDSKGNVDLEATNAASSYDQCLDGFMAGSSGDSGSNSSGSNSSGNVGIGSTNSSAISCTSYTYGAWGECTNGTQVRTIATQLPAGCSNTASAVVSQACTTAKPVVTNTTNASQSSASPVLSVTTDRAAACQYNAAGGFTYGSGITFGYTGNFNHNSTLSGLANGSQTYYVVCKDNLSGGMSDTLKIVFTVDLSLDPNNAPVVASTTPSSQTSEAPVLSVTTDRPATCQYSQNATSTLAYQAMTTSDNYSHSASISSLVDATYTFYVICKDKATAAASAAKQIITTLNRSVIAGAPVVTSTTTSYQTTGSPTLSVSTDYASTCQYSRSYFTYGNGTLFTTDGATSHSVQLSGLVNGQYNYYVICQRTSNGVASAAGYQIIFTVNIGVTNTCANLSSNDRQNDGDRSNAGNTSANSVYPWQAVETGTRDKFTKVDWYAGYQFTPNKNGQVTQLCGYFVSGVTNKVTLYSGSYAELASAQITGNGSWQCVNVSPAPISTDARYYVIARVQNNPIYFEYKSGLFPKDSGNVRIEAGIRQTVIDSKFMTAIVKYDYMIFGLVDVRISYAQTSVAGPVISSTLPVGTVNSSSATISAQTDAGATCRFDRDDVSYDDMNYSLPSVSSGVFSQKVCGLEDGSYTFYVRCKSAGGTANNSSALIQFKIAQ